MNKQQREMQKMALKAQKLAMKTVQQQQKKEALVGTRIFVQVQVRDSHNHTKHTLVHTPHTFFFRSEFLFLCLHETMSKHSSFTNSQTKKKTTGQENLRRRRIWSSGTCRYLRSSWFAPRSRTSSTSGNDLVRLEITNVDH